ncbi:MAG: sporulation protein YqfD [Clostridia bacterium]|nr:sporulation protein YqfD [Clostridia bacterium]
MKGYLFLLGFTAFSVAESEAGALFELLRREGFSPKGIERCEKNGEIRFFCTWFSARRLKALAAREGIALCVRRQGGAPHLLARLCARPGLVCGIVLALLLVIASRFFVWDIEIYGNERLSREEIEESLALAGLTRGTFLPTLDRDSVVGAVRHGDARIAYMAIRRHGTVVSVQIREAEPTPAERVNAPANLVAKCDGVIVLPLIYEGECLVQEGQVVRAGEILAGGLLDTDNNGYRITRAAGQVIARTVHTYTVTVPFTYEEKVYTGQKGYELSLFFFNSAGKILKTTGNIGVECDIIENKNWLTVGKDRNLPFGWALSTHLAFEWRTATRTATEAHALAKAELEAQLAADSAGRTLLSRTVETQLDADGITLLCTVVCEEDIASVVEIAFPAA